MADSSLKLSIEEIQTAFESLDVSMLEKETLDNMLKLFPTTDQMGRFGASEMDPSMTNTVVEIYLRMIQMPCVYKILRVALLKNEFADRFDPLRSNLDLLNRLSTEAIRSPKLRRVLDTIPTSHFLANGSHCHKHHQDRAAGPPAAPSLSNPLFTLIPDRGSRSKASSSPSPNPSPPPSPPRSNTKLLAAASPPVPPPLTPPGSYKLSLPPRAHLVWNQQFVLESEPSPHYTWKAQHSEENGRESLPQVQCSPSPPPPPPPPSDWHSWTPQYSSYKRVARRHEPKELEMLAKELKEREDLIHASRSEYGYAKLKAAGEKGSSIMRELCINLSRRSADLMEFCIESEIPCLKEAAGLELKSWRQCQKELQDLRTEFDEVIVEWKTSIRKCIGAGSTRDMMDAFISEKEQELQKLSKFLTEVRTRTENLFYHLEADRHKRRPAPAYLDEDEPIVGIFLKFLDCFKATASEIQLERQRALHLLKVNLLDAILGADDVQLDANHLRNLISFCPSEVQIHVFKHLVKEMGSTEKARERVSTLLLGGPNIHAKLKLLSVKMNLPCQAEKLRLRLTNLLEATKEILQSVELNSVVKLIASPKKPGPTPLSLEEVSQGERSRPNTPPTPPAASFRSSSFDGSCGRRSVSHDGRRIPQILDLKLLYQLRSKSLHDLVKYISEVHPELLDFYKTLPHLESGTQAAEDLLTIADDMRTLVEGIELVEMELKDLQLEGDKGITGTPNDEKLSDTISLWKTFVLKAEAEYESISKLWGEARSQTYLLVDYFHENRVQFPVKHGFEAILNFVRRFQKTVKALESEGKGAAKEEEQLQFEMESTPAVKSDAERHDQDPQHEEKDSQEGEEKTLRRTSSQIHNIFSV